MVYNCAAISIKAARRMERTTMAATVMGVRLSSMRVFMAISLIVCLPDRLVYGKDGPSNFPIRLFPVFVKTRCRRYFFVAIAVRMASY